MKKRKRVQFLSEGTASKQQHTLPQNLQQPRTHQRSPLASPSAPSSQLLDLLSTDEGCTAAGTQPIEGPATGADATPGATAPTTCTRVLYREEASMQRKRALLAQESAVQQASIVAATSALVLQATEPWPDEEFTRL